MPKLQFLQANRNAFYPPPAGGGPVLEFVTYRDLNATTQDLATGTLTSTGAYAYGLGTKKAVLPGRASLELQHNPIFDYGIAGWYSDSYAAFANVRYGIYVDSATTWMVFVEGSGSGYPGGGWNPSDVFHINIYPDRVEWLRNGELVYTLQQAPAYAELWAGGYMSYGQCAWTMRAGAENYVLR
ncbi:hypothetical protein [Hymenobacter yonginensis]|uniref:Uncharacterized protein n=1 Tax=Hymenobacter yonginensis TaxID=748197 RepID=A0ABY7PTM5_9BACT|nr:hypothetical protein [Hymenobacter yonginensis]WBO86261.1 hypothetical protein O9Z63_08360 [Hymenobacter yonginensis]